MIYVLSDIHGRLNHSGLEEYVRIAKEEDLLIILGDVGLWFAEHENYMDFTEWLLSVKKNIAFIDGNHENFERIFQYPDEIFCGGHIGRITNHLIYLKRGYIFNLNHRTFLVMGGCKSSGKWKHAGLWQKEEIPSDYEIQRAYANLKVNGNKVDYILTHQYFSTVTKDQEEAALQKLNRYIDEHVKYKKWYSGHWHQNADIDEKHSIIYDRLLKLD